MMDTKLHSENNLRQDETKLLNISTPLSRQSTLTFLWGNSGASF